jgi:hypothetical protein
VHVATWHSNLDHHCFHDVVTDGARHTRTGRMGQSFKPVRSEPVPPLGHRGAVRAELVSDLDTGAALRDRKHDPAAQRQRLRRRMTTRPSLQRVSFLVAELDPRPSADPLVPSPGTILLRLSASSGPAQAMKSPNHTELSPDFPDRTPVRLRL